MLASPAVGSRVCFLGRAGCVGLATLRRPRVLLRLLHLPLLAQRLLPSTLYRRLRGSPAHQRRPLERARRSANKGTTATLTARASSCCSPVRSKLTRMPLHRSPRSCPTASPSS